MPLADRPVAEWNDFLFGVGLGDYSNCGERIDLLGLSAGFFCRPANEDIKVEKDISRISGLETRNYSSYDWR